MLFICVDVLLLCMVMLSWLIVVIFFMLWISLIILWLYFFLSDLLFSILLVVIGNSKVVINVGWFIDRVIKILIIFCLC